MKQKLLLLIALVLANVFYVSAEMFEQVSSTLNLGSVYYMTKAGNVDANGVLFDQKVIDDLKGAGYDLTVGYPAEGGVIDANTLNGSDVVVVGRNITSGDFLAAQWGEVKAPVLVLSGYAATNSKLKLLNASSTKREVDAALQTNKDRVTKAKIEDANDPAFHSVAVTDGKLDWMTWFYDYIAYGVDTFATTNNGKLLASVVDAEKTAANGNVLMARWEPGKETYAGSGFTPKSYFSYLQMGADDKSSPKNYNYAQYTAASFQVILSEINFLMRTYQNVHYFVKAGNVDANSVLFDQKVLDDLSAAGYKNITKTYTGEGGIIDVPELNKVDLIVVGRNITSGDFLAAQWAEINAPVLVLSGYAVTNSKLKLLNASSVKREVDAALQTNKTRVTKALVAASADSAFIGINVVGGKMDWMTWFYDYIAYGVDTFATTNNGMLLASVVDAEKAAANGNVLMARWKPGVETYTGSGVTPKSYRTYLQMGADDKSSPKVYNYAQYTGASFDLMLNEMSYLAGTMPGKIMKEISSDATLDTLIVSEGALDPVFSADVTNYSVELPEGTTAVPSIEATANSEFATIEKIDATAIPGTTTVRVTAEDQKTIITYLVNFKTAGGTVEEGVVEPGVGTLDEAVMLAESGDTLVLKNGGVYDILSPLEIDKKLVIIAQEIPELPALENMPVISNLFTSTQVFGLKTDCDLTLIGIDVDALGGSFIFDPMADSNQVVTLYVNRCRLHNTTNDIFNDDGSYTNNITLGSCYVRNTFIYDNGVGHGFYTKNLNANGSLWKFENITMWNLGQQFNWIRARGEDQTQTVIFDHMTGYNLSTSVSDNKELIGNDEKLAGEGEASLVVEFKNNIMSTQVSTNEGSLIFKNTDGFHTISVNNNVLFEVAAMGNIGTVTVADNLEGTDPQFADAANGDFTVGNADLYTAATDGKIVGALYWHPEFVDDFSDVTTPIGIRDNSALNVAVYPNPFNAEINLSAELLTKGNVSLAIFNINGQMVKNANFGTMAAGKHNFTQNMSDLKSGIYFYQLISNDLISTGKIVKH